MEVVGTIHRAALILEMLVDGRLVFALCVGALQCCPGHQVVAPLIDAATEGCFWQFAVAASLLVE
eukprot:6832067-Prymnesium_polylepis.1